MLNDQETEQKENKSPKVLSAVPNYLQLINSTPSGGGVGGQFKVTTNPFESGLIERMKRPSFLSPNVLKMSSSITEETEFQWTIDDLSRIAPVPIDEDNTHSQCTDTLDSEAESEVQEVIDKYFTHHHAIPSPCWKSPKIKYGTAASSTPEHKKSSPSSEIEVCNMSTQTVLSLPPKLPEHIEELLKPYFMVEENVVADEGDNSLNLSNSRRKLKFSPGCEAVERSPIFSGHHVSPTHMSLLPTTPIIKSRTLFSPANIESPTEISPIVNSFNKTATRLLVFSSESESSSSNYQTPSSKCSFLNDLPVGTLDSRMLS
uniref:Protein aurora borealis n=1 Tax=Cacopsylla melanoneura TaxID=428564 RepID=A0A8D8T4I1_9HEMI